MSGRGIIVPVDEDAQGRALEIIELAGAKRPEEAAQAAKPQQQRHRDQEGQPVHRAAPRSRSALPTTISDEADIASAAIKGVTTPAIASGTASTL